MLKILLVFYGVRPSSFYVAWAALSSTAASVRLHMHARASLRVSGFEASSSIPEQHGRPWQLVVHGAESIHGLPMLGPRLCVKAKHYLLQNAAACAAGWCAATSIRALSSDFLA